MNLEIGKSLLIPLFPTHLHQLIDQPPLIAYKSQQENMTTKTWLNVITSTAGKSCNGPNDHLIQRYVKTI